MHVFFVAQVKEVVVVGALEAGLLGDTLRALSSTPLVTLRPGMVPGFFIRGLLHMVARLLDDRLVEELSCCSVLLASVLLMTPAVETQAGFLKHAVAEVWSIN